MAARKNKIKLGTVKIKSLPDLKQVYGERFSEKIMLYNLLEYMYSRRGCPKFTGDAINAKIGDGEVDFLIHSGNYTILIEYKDVLFPADTKHSYDFSIIKETLKLKMDENQNGKPKGISQLLNSIKDVSNGRYSFIVKKPQKMKIYPVIIYTDYTFDLMGFNYLLNKELKSRIEKEQLNIREVKNLTLINLDTLIKFQDLFASKALDLKTCIDDYHKYIKRKQPKNPTEYMKQVISFDIFMNTYTVKMRPEPPKIFMREVLKIVGDKSKGNEKEV